MTADHDVSETVAVIDDDAAILRSIARLLAMHGLDARLFPSAASFLDELRAGEISPSCIIADLSMPDLSGLDLQQRLARENFRYPMIVITAFGDVRTSVSAMRGGAVDFLTKPFKPRDLVDAVYRALDRWRETRKIGAWVASAIKRLALLTPRERAVFEEVVRGRLNKQIAASLGISEKTVKVHRARVMRKMSMRSVAELARFAQQLETHSDRVA